MNLGAFAEPQRPVAGRILQVVYAQSNAWANVGSVAIPADDTIPQSTEGNFCMQVTITPLSAVSTLLIYVNVALSNTAGAAYSQEAALFQDNNVNAFDAHLDYVGTNAAYRPLQFVSRLVTGSTAQTTIKLRAGASGATAQGFNGQSSGRLLGGALTSIMRVMEYAT